MVRPNEKNECSHSGKSTFFFFWGVCAENTQLNSVPSRYATLITLLTLLPGVSSSLSEWLTCLSVLGRKQEPCPPFLSRHRWLTSWMLFPPLLMSICSANCNRIRFSWTAFSAIFLLVVGCPFRSTARCGEACPPERDVFKIWSLTFSQALKVLGLTYTQVHFSTWVISHSVFPKYLLFSDP